MSANATLEQRIQAEFEARGQRARAAEHDRAKEAQGRQARLQQFSKACDDLRAIWRPKLEAFARQFGDKIKMTPSISPSLREARAVFATDLASVTLTLSAAPDDEITRLILNYDLLIIPIFFEYERSARLEMPLDKIDTAAVSQWIDDHLVSCVKAYLSMEDNELYLKRALVEDPISKTRLMRENAAAKLDYQGHTFYFESLDTLARYKEKLQVK